MNLVRLRRFLGLSILALLLSATAASAQSAALAACADVSALAVQEAGGAVYRDAEGNAADPLALFAARGLDAVRLRVWHTPDQAATDGSSGTLANALALARRADALGMDIVLTLHYSDTWADPAHQTPPAAWQALALPALADSVQDYTRRVVQAFAHQGTVPEAVALGNEISGGMLWPTGRVGGAFDTDAQWQALGTLLEHAHAGLRVAAPGATALIHTDRGGDAGSVQYLFDHLRQQSVPFDAIALSYYPWWHGDLDALGDALGLAATRYGVPVHVIETAYPWTLAWDDDRGNIIGEPGQMLAGYPASPGGQAAFVEAVRGAVGALPESQRGTVCYWAPDWIAAPAASSPWENLALFDFDGRLLPGAAALGGVTTTGIESGAAVASTVAYPNPAGSSVTIRAACHGDAVRVELRDLFGRRVRSVFAACEGGTATARLDVYGLAPGVYGFVVDGGMGRFVAGRIVVAR